MKPSKTKSPERSQINILPDLWKQALQSLAPEVLLNKHRCPAPDPRRATLYWGKAARAFAKAQHKRCTGRRGPELVISPETSEHPIPGAGSLKAGAALLTFFERCKRQKIRALDVYLSGGASSLAWLPPADLRLSSLQQKLKALYRKKLNIQQLNRARSKLCLLKDGGAARLAKKLCPYARIHVYVVSDVEPFAVNIVGSGPFFDKKIPHTTLASNTTLRSNFCTLPSKTRCSGIKEWLQISKKFLIKPRPHILALGGEPLLSLPAKRGKGGRLTHLALLILDLMLEQKLDPKNYEVLCAASDGDDGRSGSAGAYLSATTIKKRITSGQRSEMRKAIEHYDSASFFRKHFPKALLQKRRSNTNVQDVLLLVSKVRSKASE